MSSTTFRVFVSATSQDLGSYRAVVKEELLNAGILPVTQENFGPDYRSLCDYLKIEISKCEAVICLVGHIFGAEPHEIVKNRRSYTQLEYLFAIQQNKPVFVFLTDKDFVPDNDFHENDEVKKLQFEHRKLLRESGLKYEVFTGLDDLKVKIARAIRKIDQSFARPHMFYRHLPRSPGYFAGRVKEIHQVWEALSSKKSAVIVVMGMGGQGKTTLVHRALVDMENLPFISGFWCTAYRGGYTFDMFLDDVLTHFLKSDFDKRLMPDLSSRINRILSVLQEQPTLLVIDGIERWLNGWNSEAVDPQFVETVQERKGFHTGLDEFLLQVSGLTNGSHIIITTRALPAVLDNVARSNIPVVEESDEEMSLEGLDSEASVELLRKLGAIGTEARLREISESYANHPLALTILGTLLKKKYGGQVDRLPRAEAMDPRHELYKLFDEIRENLPIRESSEHFLKVVSQCFEHPSLEVIAAGMYGSEVNEKTIDNLLDHAVTLFDWNLISWNGLTQIVCVHPLIKRYFGSILSMADSEIIHERLSKWYGNSNISAKATSLDDIKPRILAIKHSACASNLDQAAEYLFTSMIDEYSLFTWLGMWGHQMFGIKIIEELAQSADDELRGHFLLAQAQLYHQLARPQLAVSNIEESISIFENQALSKSQQAMSNLAKSYATRGNIHRMAGLSSDAIKDFNKAIGIIEELDDEVGDKQYDLAKTFANRGNAWRGVGELSRSIEDHTKAYHLWEELDGEKWDCSLVLAPTLTNRGVAFLDLGKFDHAIADFERSIAISSRCLLTGKQEMVRHMAHAKSMLGITYSTLGNYDAALEYTEDAVRDLQKLVDLGRTDASNIFALSLLNRAKIYMKTGKLKNALQDSGRSILIFSRLTSEAGFHFNATLSHAECVQAEIKHKLGDIEGSREDRERGFERYHKVIHKWPSEHEIRVEFLRDILKAVQYLFPTDKDECKMLLDEFIAECQIAFSEDYSSEALKYTVICTTSILNKLVPDLGVINYDTSKVKELIDKVKLKT